MDARVQYLTRLDDIPARARIAVFGAGKQGQALYRALNQHRADARVCFFLDDWPVPGGPVPVIKPDALHARRDEVDMVIVAARHSDMMVVALRRMNVLSFLVVHPALDLAHMFFPEEWQAALPLVKRVSAMLHPSDRDLYMRLMSAREVWPELLDVACSTPNITCPRSGSQYLDYLNLSAIRVVMEGGVATGTSTMEFIRRLPHLSRLHGFEPCFELYQRSSLRAKIEATGICNVRPVGLWRRPGRLWLKVQHAWSRILLEPDGSADCRAVEVTSVDAFASEASERIDMVKLDIEGGETDAIEGAWQTLRAHRPQVAISIYHTKEDMTALPLRLKDELPDYTFRVGHYSDSFSETVLYGIPNEKLV